MGTELVTDRIGTPCDSSQRYVGVRPRHGPAPGAVRLWRIRRGGGHQDHRRPHGGRAARRHGCPVGRQDGHRGVARPAPHQEPRQRAGQADPRPRRSLQPGHGRTASSPGHCRVIDGDARSRSTTSSSPGARYFNSEGCGPNASSLPVEESRRRRRRAPPHFDRRDAAASASAGLSARRSGPWRGTAGPLVLRSASRHGVALLDDDPPSMDQVSPTCEPCRAVPTIIVMPYREVLAVAAPAPSPTSWSSRRGCRWSKSVMSLHRRRGPIAARCCCRRRGGRGRTARSARPALSSAYAGLTASAFAALLRRCSCAIVRLPRRGSRCENRLKLLEHHPDPGAAPGRCRRPGR